MNIKILQQNMECNNKTKEINIENLLQTWFVKNPDVILLSEFCYARYKEDIIECLEKEGYEIITPYDFTDNDKINKSITCACTMAVKSNITFKLRERENIRLSARYIEGTLKTNGKSIEIFFAYIPQTSDKNIASDRLEKKAEMLFGMSRFWNEYKEKNIFIGGDLNTEIIKNKQTSMDNLFKTLYNDMIDTDTHEPTWDNKCLDYALVSEPLRNCCCTTRLNNTELDHVGLFTEIRLD